MKVLKFGGTSVGTIESLRNVKQIIEGQNEPVVVVVSALGGLTDKLIATGNKAAAKIGSYRDDIISIRDRHHDIIKGVVKPDKQDDCRQKTDILLDQLGNLYDGVALIGDISQKTMDLIVSFGERISSIIVSSMVKDASHINSLDIVKTEKYYGKNIADTKLTEENIKGNLHPEYGKPIIAGGFISTDRDSGEVTNLGRGGSDYTAALIAAALDADELQIWTDVDGFMTSDPRIIPDAKIVPMMSFVESMELCTFGAKVIYPPTIYPVFHKNIPIKILNTFKPEAQGTLIKDYSGQDLKEHGKVRGLSALKDIAIIKIKGSLTRNPIVVSSRTFSTLSNRGFSVFIVTSTEENDSFSLALRQDDLDSAAALIHSEFAPEISAGLIDSIESINDLAIVAVVGEEILAKGYISPRIINTLERAQISPVALSEGASKTTVTFAVPQKHTTLTLQLIHSLFF